MNNPDDVVSRYIQKLDRMIEKAPRKDKFKAIGECGLDYDRLEFADKES